MTQRIAGLYPLRITEKKFFEILDIYKSSGLHSEVGALTLAIAGTFQEIVDEFERKLDGLKTELADLTRYDMGAK